MRWHSTRNSYKKQEWSLLAISETSMAFAMLIFIAFRFHTLNHLLLTSVFGWLLLLRTTVSERRGAMRYSKLIEWCNTYETVMSERASDMSEKFPATNTAQGDAGLTSSMSAALVLIIGPPVIKAVETLRTLRDHPRLTISSIPENWAKAVFCLDATINLELVPGYEEHILDAGGWRPKPDAITLAESFADVRYSTLYRQFRDGSHIIFYVCGAWFIVAACVEVYFFSAPWFVACMVFLVGALFLSVTPMRIVFYAIPALCYRFSLKATAVAYWPFLFNLHSSSSDNSLSYKLRSIRDGKVSEFKRFFCWLVISVIMVKIVLWSLLVKLRDAFPNDIIRFIIDDYLSPKLNGWQWASLINALMAIVTYWLADYWIRRTEEGLAVEPSTIMRYLNYTGNMAGILSVYSIWANISIVVHRTSFLRIPPFGKTWPW